MKEGAYRASASCFRHPFSNTWRKHTQACKIYRLEATLRALTAQVTDRLVSRASNFFSREAPSSVWMCFRQVSMNSGKTSAVCTSYVRLRVVRLAQK